MFIKGIKPQGKPSYPYPHYFRNLPRKTISLDKLKEFDNKTDIRYNNKKAFLRVYSSDWLERLLDMQEVDSSSLFKPTRSILMNRERKNKPYVFFFINSFLSVKNQRRAEVIAR